MRTRHLQLSARCKGQYDCCEKLVRYLKLEPTRGALRPSSGLKFDQAHHLLRCVWFDRFEWTDFRRKVCPHCWILIWEPDAGIDDRCPSVTWCSLKLGTWNVRILSRQLGRATLSTVIKVFVSIVHYKSCLRIEGL